jgi:predicted naringenin-chalcone synthase
MQCRAYIGDFRSHAPAFRLSQDASLRWLTLAHGRAERTRADRENTPFDASAFESELARRMKRVACAPAQVAERGHELEDFTHTDWERMHVYRLHAHPSGESTLVRGAVYRRFADAAVERMYAAVDEPPSDLIHVTCTGYESPSAAQRFVAARGWGAWTRVTHAYHMGCYAAVPALRLAATALTLGRRADVVHTEYCTLHLNPLCHTPEALVIQSLFSDGAIAYRLATRRSELGAEPALALAATDEVLLADSGDAMSWRIAENGMQMTLARDVPERLAGAVGAFVERLCERAELAEAERRRAIYAIHPGGPRIIDLVGRTLALSEEQVDASRRVLFSRGNMSSATLPHVWHELLRSPDVATGTPIVSLAFGPGLTLCGAVARKAA